MKNNIEKKISRFLKSLGKDKSGCYFLYDKVYFDELFKLLLESGRDHEEGLMFIFAHCSLSGIIFQERIHNNYYKKIMLDPDKFDLRTDLVRIWEEIKSEWLKQQVRIQ